MISFSWDTLYTLKEEEYRLDRRRLSQIIITKARVTAIRISLLIYRIWRKVKAARNKFSSLFPAICLTKSSTYSGAGFLQRCVPVHAIGHWSPPTWNKQQFCEFSSISCSFERKKRKPDKTRLFLEIRVPYLTGYVQRRENEILHVTS